MGAEFAADFFADFLSTWVQTLPIFLGADFFGAENLTKHMLFITQKIGTPKIGSVGFEKNRPEFFACKHCRYVDGWLSGWVVEWMDDWVTEWLDDWMVGLMSEWIDGQMYEKNLF